MVPPLRYVVCVILFNTVLLYLARLGLPLRGYEDPETQTESESNFVPLMKLRGKDYSRIAGWLEKKTDKYTSPDIQNEIIKTMAVRQVIDPISSSLFLSLMVNQTTDMSNKEQQVLCI